MQSDIDYNMCMAICQRQPDCEFIVYRFDRRNCSLKKKSGTENFGWRGGGADENKKWFENYKKLFENSRKEVLKDNHK